MGPVAVVEGMAHPAHLQVVHVVLFNDVASQILLPGLIIADAWASQTLLTPLYL